MRFVSILSFALVVPVSGLTLACSGGSGPQGPASNPDSGYFESSINSGGPGRGGLNAGAAGSSSGGPGAAPEAADSGGDAAREIAEADIIQIQGTTLYAMSRTGGLSIIDVSTPSDLKILGRYRTSFTPFEMYVKDGIVFAMYTDWGQFVLEEGTEDQWVWKQTSALLALDATDPTSITKISQFDLPGEISDSRLVGDILYAVSYQNGSCWNCSSTPNTNVVSIDIADAAEPVKVDELSFDDESPEYGWGKRSISVTTERIYVAGPEYGYQQPENSTIQVVDISDPAGTLVEGTQVKVRGQITSRWQMDEYDGVLRVISQPWQWWNATVAPSIETFTVVSSQQISSLAKVQMVLPEREQLMSVRFDGPRGYAVTAVQTDPHFTIDLSDPAAPKQLGELVMPGFLYHMEPRGERLIALGYDQGNADGAITVSLFDVSDFANPTMIERVNFGGTWGSLPEDQDRIHKAFKIDPDNQLILVPFAGWQPSDTSDWCGQSLNGVQLVDFAGDDIALRGMTQSLGQARRAFIADDKLFTVADQEVAAYDITDRDAPEQISGAPLSLNVSLTLPAGDKLVRLRQDWYSSDMRLEVVAKSTPDALVASTTFNLTDYLRQHQGLAACGYWYPSNEPLFAVGDNVWALINDYGEWSGDGYDKGRSLLVGFSPETGEVTGSLALPFAPGYWGWGNTSRIIRGDVVLLMQEGWDQQGAKRSLAAIDLSNPDEPRLAYSVDLPTNDYYGSTGLLESGDEIVTSYAEQVQGKPDVVRHFALRIDVSDPLSPSLIGSYNVPGYLVDFDAAEHAAVTLDHQPLAVKGSSWEDCAQKLPSGWFDETASLCRGYTATLHRVSLAAASARVLDSLRDDQLLWTTPRRGDGRLFFTGGYYGYGYGIADVGFGPGGYYYGGWSWATQQITVVDSATLAHGTIEAPGVWNVLPSGTALVLAPSAGQPLSVIDGSDAEQPVLRAGEETALGYTNHLSISGKDVFLSQGDGGVQRMTLP
jgi:hypothetical protein